MKNNLNKNLLILILIIITITLPILSYYYKTEVITTLLTITNHIITNLEDLNNYLNSLLDINKSIISDENLTNTSVIDSSTINKVCSCSDTESDLFNNAKQFWIFSGAVIIFTLIIYNLPTEMFVLFGDEQIRQRIAELVEERDNLIAANIELANRVDQLWGIIDEVYGFLEHVWRNFRN